MELLKNAEKKFTSVHVLNILESRIMIPYHNTGVARRTLALKNIVSLFANRPFLTSILNWLEKNLSGGLDVVERRPRLSFSSVK